MPDAITPPPPPIPPTLLQEIQEFQKQCRERYGFNSRWDTALNILGVTVSLGIVAAGVYKANEIAAILGGLVTAIVSAQRAFPFNQRWQFYRVMNGQVDNLLTEAGNGILTLDQTIATLKALRLDFAQQIPRGSSFRSDSAANDQATTPNPDQAKPLAADSSPKA